MKKYSLLLTVLLVIAFTLFALGSGESEQTMTGPAASEKADDSLGKYSVTIDSFRMAKDYEGDPVVIVKYIFTNVSDSDPTSFMVAFEDNVFQAGVGLNRAFLVEDSANYSADNQTKEIKAGATLEVEVAYELNDTTTGIDVEVQELFSFSDKVISKSFSISE